MSENIRFQTTAVIWSALAAIMIFTDTNKIALAFILGIAAAVSTIVIWESKSEELKVETKSAASKKMKRDDRAKRLIEIMDEDEIDDMEAYLAARHDDRTR